MIEETLVIYHYYIAHLFYIDVFKYVAENVIYLFINLFSRYYNKDSKGELEGEGGPFNAGVLCPLVRSVYRIPSL